MALIKLSAYGISRISAKKAEVMSPWDLADLLGIRYTGDMNPFDHGGTFYEVNNWNEHGYADCVRFQEVDGKTWVECGTINQHLDMESSYKCCDTPQEVRGTPEGDIESVLGYWGMDTNEDFSGAYRKIYTDEQETRCWREVIGWIKGLTN